MITPSEKQKLLKEEGILNSWRYRVLLHKAFFGKGQSILSEFKVQYLIVALAIVDIASSILGILIFGIGSYVIGRLWYSRIRGASLTEIEAEVGNQFNKFQQEMREIYKKDSFIKGQYNN